MLKIYLYPKCSTCIKARNYLKNNNLRFDEINITQKPPTSNELNNILKHSNDHSITQLIESSKKVKGYGSIKEKNLAIFKKNISNMPINFVKIENI